MVIKRIGALIAFCLFVTSLFALINVEDSCNREQEVLKGKLAAHIDQYLTRITPFGFSGALLVAQEGEIVLNKGYGLAIRAEGIPNTSQTILSTGSITKQFTAAGIMKLEMMGKLNTNDRMSKYIQGVPEDKADITLHHLLTHTAGVVDFVGEDYEVAPRDETVKKILAAPLHFKPGEQFQYSNAGYSLLAAIIETVSGQTYEEFLHQHLFEPAGMNFTGYRIPPWDQKIVAHWYVGDKDNGAPLEKPYPYWNLLGNGGILSTTGDMYKWHLALMGNTVLSTEAKKKLYTPFLNDYAYGWDVLKTERGALIQHDGGSMLGSSAEFRRYIDAGIVTMLFCNQAFEGRALFDPIRDKIETLAFGGHVTIPPPVKSFIADELKAYQGEYRLTSGGVITAVVQNGALVLKPEGQDALNLLFNPKQYDPELYDNINNRSAAVFAAVVNNDFQPFEEALLRKEGLPRFRQFITMRLQRLEEMMGVIQKVEALGTLPSTFDEGDTVVTVIKLKCERGDFFFRLFWQGGKIVALGPAMSGELGSIIFQPETRQDFVGYHLGMARIVRLSFITDQQGKINGLLVNTRKGSITAKKSKEPTSGSL
jgi:CubicO group peptidase (beta-lactamase class C family)